MKKILLFSLTLFFLKLADGMFTFWAPVQIKSALGSEFLMGIIISIQSILGLTMDLVFPKLLGTFKTRSLIFWSIIVTMTASILLFSTAYFPFVLLFLITMLAWAIYFELTSFANYQFVGCSIEKQERPMAWGILNFSRNLAFLIGPIIASILLIKSVLILEVVIVSILFVAFIVFFATSHIHEIQTDLEFTRVNPWLELTHWEVLLKTVWPAIIMSLLIGFIDATYWTIGAVWAERIIITNYLGGLIIPSYILPSLITGLVLIKFEASNGKKFITEKLLLVVGILLTLMSINNSMVWKLVMIFLSSGFLSVCYPLLDGVYSDLISRMGKEKKDMIGLTSATLNLSYIIWPPIAGLLATKFGESLTFSYLGVLVFITALILLFITPKKLRLPQEEIRRWDVE